MTWIILKIKLMMIRSQRKSKKKVTRTVFPFDLILSSSKLNKTYCIVVYWSFKNKDLTIIANIVLRAIGSRFDLNFKLDKYYRVFLSSTARVLVILIYLLLRNSGPFW